MLGVVRALGTTLLNAVRSDRPMSRIASRASVPAIGLCTVLM